MSFYVILPSNSPVEGNKTNSFRVRLPRKLEFRAEWSVGLAVFMYPRTWPTIGAFGTSEFIRISWTDGIPEEEISIAPSSVITPISLVVQLNAAIAGNVKLQLDKINLLIAKVAKVREQARNVADADAEHWFQQAISEQQKRINQTGQKYLASKKIEDEKQAVFDRRFAYHFKHLLPDQLSSVELGILQKITPDTTRLVDDLEHWRSAISNQKCNFGFSEERQRFFLSILNASSECRLEKLYLSDQLAFIMGFRRGKFDVRGGCHAKQMQYDAEYLPDLSGGISTLYVYAPGLIEPVIVGDCSAPLLRVALVRGQQNEIVEDTYVAIQYHRLLVKEVNEIQIEIRGATGNPMPFQSGNCILTLHFKKLAYF